MEKQRVLNINNDAHMHSLQYIFIPRMNRALFQFKEAWNGHPLSTMRNLSPIQLWIRELYHTQTQETFTEAETLSEEDTQSYGMDWSILVSQEDENQNQVLEIGDLSDEAVSDLQAQVRPLQDSSNYGVDLYFNALNYICQQLQLYHLNSISSLS